VAAVTWALPATPVAADTTPTTDVIAVSDHTCVVTTVGGVKCWGDNNRGGLGDGTMTPSSSPVDVMGLASGVTAIAAGDRYSCALTSGGGVRCWGYNEFGQLGDGTNTDRATPVDVTGLPSGVSAIDARGEHTCALLTAGGVKCWGANINGQLGDGTTASSGVPVDVAGLTSGVSAIAVGGEHSCALTSGSGLKCWGLNAKGQVGIGTTTDSDPPVDVAGLAGGVSAVAAGFYHVCGITKDGGVTCWGGNESGQLGIGTTSDSPTMTGVKNADGTPLIAAGGGDSENSNLLPIAVAVLVGVVLILAGGGFWLARRRGH
jgi:alpha-tubulin suppressor-like RCC1 family protein